MKASDGHYNREIIETDDWSKMQFWMPIENENEAPITVNKLYPLYYDRAEEELFIFDDFQKLSVAFEICAGKFYKFARSFEEDFESDREMINERGIQLSDIVSKLIDEHELQ